MIDKAKRIPGYVWRHRREFHLFGKYAHRQMREHRWRVAFAIFGLLMFRIYSGSWLIALFPHSLVFLTLFLRWKWRYLKKIDSEGAGRPGRWELIKAWWFETKRFDQGREGWRDGCAKFGLTPPNERPAKGKRPTTPNLLDPIIDLDGDLETPIAPGRIGVPVERVIKAAPDLAQRIGCRELVVTPDYNNNGCATLKMYWSNPTARISKIKDLPYPKKYTDLVIGRKRDGSAATISWEAGPVLIVGITGSGKSGVIWNIMADVTDRQVPCKIAASDPKGGMELRKLKRSKRVTHFASNPTETVQLVNDMVAEMRRRQPLIESRKLTIPTEEFPLYLIPLDEIVTCMPMLMNPQTNGAGRAAQAPIIQLLNEARSALMFPILASQAGHASIIGDNRNLVPQRILLRVPSASSVGTVIPDGLERGVMAHRLHPINDRGIGWVEDQHGNVEKFRAHLITEDDIDRLADDRKVKGMTRESRTGVKKPIKDTYVYHAMSYDKIGQAFDRVGYVGISNDPDTRFKQHRAKDWAFCKEHGQWENWWVQHVDESKMIIEGPYTREEAERKIEKEAIKSAWPVWNEVHNWNNPVAKTWGKVSNGAKTFPTRIRASREKTHDDLVWQDDTVEIPVVEPTNDELAALIDSELEPVTGEVVDEPVTRNRRTPLPPLAPYMLLVACALVSIMVGVGGVS